MPKILNSSRNKEGNEIHDNSHDLSLNNRCEMILSMEDKISLEETYILGLCGTQTEPEFRFAAALSDYSSVIYNVGENLTKLITLTDNDSPIVGIKFSPSSKNILYTATKQGTITACDLRAKGRIIAELKDNSAEGKLRPLSSFDISGDDKLVAAGTEHTGGDAFILFWDVRYNNSKSNSKNDLLGGYWESLMDDVTSLTFHPNKPNILTSGSTDGLINVFDVTQPSEDSALSYSLNTESSVDRLGWLADDIWCTTHTHSLQLWKCEDACPFIKYERNNIETYLAESQDSSYLVNMHSPETLNQPFLLTGASSTKGENLHGVIVKSDGMEICYDFPDNKQIVRDSWYHDKSGLLITGGEGGFINVWKPSQSLTFNRNMEQKLIMKTNGKEKLNRAKPY
ncbi:hypothetical protein PV327_008372 [Microctonus hyperodae]|uniref:WD repeat-containing protein 89 n=1 Tax=Microctonus hyperodae TaxID=165561 RepID=A0AA39KHC0_MICHY|nr:hypothetical protein PV327_008372 [Microctonus hyperodae]